MNIKYIATKNFIKKISKIEENNKIMSYINDIFSEDIKINKLHKTRVTDLYLIKPNLKYRILLSMQKENDVLNVILLDIGTPEEIYKKHI